MADRMNIKFTIQAVDKFSRTMTALERKLDSVKRKADSLDLNRTADINVDTSGAISQIEALQSRIDSLGGASSRIDVDVNSGAALAELTAIRAAAESISNTTVRVDADTSRATAGLAAVNSQRERINGTKTVVRIVLEGYQTFRRNMDRIATTGRNVGEIVTNSFMGLATTFSTTLVPMIASSAGTIGSLGVSLGTTAGAAMGLATAGGIAAGGFGIFASVASSSISNLIEMEHGLKRGSDEWNALSTETQRTIGILKQFQLAWRTMTESFNEPIANVFGDFLEIAMGLIGRFEPIIGQTVIAMDNLVAKFGEIAESSDFIAFFEAMETAIRPAMEAIGGVALNAMVGFMNLIRAFLPLSVSMQDGLLAMSERFVEWSSSLSSSTGFKEFTDYIQTNWPLIRSIVADAIMGIIAVFAAFSPYAADWIAKTASMMASFRAFAESLGQNQQFQEFLAYIRANAPAVTGMIGDFIQFLVALGVAVAPVGAAMVRVASNILQFLTSLLQANPEIGNMLAWIIALSGGFFTLLPIGMAIVSFAMTLGRVLMAVIPSVMRIGGAILASLTSFARFKDALLTVRIALMLIGGPVMWVIGILLLLVPVFIRLWQTSEQFRNIVTTAFEAVRSVVSNAISAVVAFVMSTWGNLVAWWAQNGEMIKQAATSVWNGISTVVTTAMQIISNIVQAVWPVVLAIITSVWNNIKGVITGALDIVLGAITAFSGLLTGNWSAMWEGVKQMLSGALTFIINAVQLMLWGRLIKGLAAFAGTFRAGISAMWASVKTQFSVAVGTVKQTFTTAFNAIRTTATSIMNGIRTAISNALNAIKTAFSNAWSAVTSRVSSAFNSIRTAISNGMQAARSVVTSVLNAIKSFFANAMSTIISKVSSALSKVKSTFTSGMNAAKSAVTNAVNAIKSFFQSGMQAVVSRVTAALNSVKSAFTNGMNAAKSAVTNAVNAIKNFFSNGMAQIKSKVSSGINAVKTAFSNGLERVKGIVSSAVQAIKGLFNIDLAAQGAKIVGSVARGISGAVGKVTSAIGTVTKKIRDFLPFSPAKEGALRDLDRLNFGGTIAKSISRQTGTVRRAMNDMMLSAAPNVDFAVDHSYSGASSAYAQTREASAREKRAAMQARVEVPVYLNSREIARATNDDLQRMNAREEARQKKFGGGN